MSDSPGFAVGARFLRRKGRFSANFSQESREWETENPRKD
jgi:hypothetical protein